MATLKEPGQDAKPNHTRGWTYQEEQISTRKIFLRDQQLHWECHCCSLCEDSVPYAKVDQLSGEPLDLFYDALHPVAAVPELTRLGRLISVYNSRQLAYEEDALPAFSGVLSVLSRTFTGGFLYGLPEMSLIVRSVGGARRSSSMITVQKIISPGLFEDGTFRKSPMMEASQQLICHHGRVLDGMGAW